MNVRVHRGAAAIAAVVAVAAAGALAAPAGAAGNPGFLSPSQLPPASSAWQAGPVTAGQPDPLPMCVGDALPSTSVHRAYATDLDTNALQVTVVERDTTRAKAFAALLRKHLDSCAKDVSAQDPDVTARQKYYGRLAVEDGAVVYGVHTRTTWGASDINLFSVGRDGRIVTVVRWGQMGGFADAPVSAFKRTTVTAVNKLR